MCFLEILRESIAGILSNKLRSALTMLGVIIGVGSVIVLVSIGEGARKQVVAEFESVGTNILRLYTQRWDARLTLDQVYELQSRVPQIEMLMPVVNAWEEVRYEGKNLGIPIQGVTEIFPQIREHDLYVGRWFTAAEVEIARPVVVLGWEVTQQVFAGRNPVGKTIYIGQRPFQIIGVLEEKGQYLGEGVDYNIFVPITVAQRLRGTNKVDFVYIKAKDRESVPLVQLNVERIFEFRYGENSVYVVSQQSMIEQVEKSQRTMTLMLGAIAGVSLVVGGIGVMNIMLVAVTERTREIGLRMAVGAKRRHVLFQFLAESSVLCAMGGFVGVFLGLFASALVGRLGPATALAPASVGVAFSFSIVVGLLFGMYPAMRAASLQPAVALRTE